MNKVPINTDYITLQAVLKLTGYISLGGEVKYFLSNKEVFVNNQLEIRRGRKLYPGDIIKIENENFIEIIKEGEG